MALLLTAFFLSLYLLTMAGHTSSADELRQDVAWLESAIPAELWQALRARGLLADEAPCPGDAPIELTSPRPSIEC